MTTAIREWNQQKILAEISGKVLSGMDNACSFAAEDARGRAPQRTGKLASLVDYEVVPISNFIEGRVGIGKGKDSGASASQGEAFYGRFIEWGTKRQAAQPFLRPAVYENADEIVRRVAEG